MNIILILAFVIAYALTGLLFGASVALIFIATLNYAYEKARFKVIDNSVIVLPVWWGKYFRILGYK
jgi:uncharacterized membrane protein